MTDAEAWEAHPKWRWLYDRLRLSQMLGYECGPAGTLPPRAGTWFVKPIINLNGMGVGAHARVYDGGPVFRIPPGNFWMPYFSGRHLSLDLKRVGCSWEMALAVECFYRNARPYEWRKVSDPLDIDVPISAALTDLAYLNVELVGGNLIEVHLRRNCDFDAMPQASAAFPVWEGDPVPPDMIPDPEDADGFLVPRRLGFVYRCEQTYAEPLPHAVQELHETVPVTAPFQNFSLPVVSGT